MLKHNYYKRKQQVLTEKFVHPQCIFSFTSSEFRYILHDIAFIKYFSVLSESSINSKSNYLNTIEIERELRVFAFQRQLLLGVCCVTKTRCGGGLDFFVNYQMIESPVALQSVWIGIVVPGIELPSPRCDLLPTDATKETKRYVRLKI